SIFHHRHIRNDWMFVYSSRDRASHYSGVELCCRKTVAGDWKAALRWSLSEPPFETPFSDLDRDVEQGSEFLRENLPQAILEAPDAEVELLKSVFYRNKGAYLVGRIRGGGEQVPLVLPILHDPDKGLHLDTVIIEEDEISIIYSFTRAYFLAQVPVPSELLIYLQKLMADKPAGEAKA